MVEHDDSTAGLTGPGGEARRLPADLRVARRTPDFTDAAMPPALRRAHHTSAWAELVVEAGVVEFREEGPNGPWSATVGAGDVLVIVPGRHHEVSPSADARFHVRFYEPVAP